MINVNDFSPGITFLHNNEIFLVIESSHSKSGRGKANVKTKVKNLKSQSITTLTFIGGSTVYPAVIDKRKAMFIYESGDNAIFLDQDKNDEIAVNKNTIKWEQNFLTSASEVLIRIYKNEILGIILPPSVELEVTEAPPAVKGNSVSNATKTVIVETGFELQAPMFINVGSKIVIGTEDGKYKSRAKGE